MSQWHLHTRRTSYALSLTADASGAVSDYWGPALAVGEDPAPWAEPDRFVGYAADADAQPLEYASDGQRHTAFSELLIDRGNSRTGARWMLHGEPRWRSDSSGDELELAFRDETGTLELVLGYRSSREHDVIRRWTRIANHGSDTVTLPRAFSAAWNAPVGQRVRVDYLAGSWAREFQERSAQVHWGTFSIGSRQGVTGMSFSPVVRVSALPDEDDVAARSGTDVYGVALDWSGSWRLQVESAAVGSHARVSVGVDDDVTTVTLLPGEEFRTPDSLGVHAASAIELPSRWHEFQQGLARERGRRTQPIVYNSWMATTFDVDIAQQLELARRAAAIGVETFVLDDGWFRGRTSDRAGLGGWQPDPAKFPHGLGELADGVEALGMRFGLWVEPECVNPDSDLFRAHPDWVYRAEGRPLLTIRNQYVLDLGREEVVLWVMATLRDLLSSAPIGYLKWDMNRPVTDGGRPGDPHGRQWSVQHTRNYYRVMDMLRAEFPDLIVEACASGGARIDNAVLQRSDVVWTSDQVGPRDRLVIQHGFLSAYPSWTMSSWVAEDDGHRDREAASLGYRFAVAMCGVLGIGLDLSRTSDADLEECRRRVEAYRGIRDVILDGDVRTHGTPHRGLYTVEYTAGTRSVLFVFDRDRDRVRDRDAARVFPAGLCPHTRYAVQDGFGHATELQITAEEAAVRGVPVAFSWAPDADVLILDAIER